MVIRIVTIVLILVSYFNCKPTFGQQNTFVKLFDNFYANRAVSMDKTLTGGYIMASFVSDSGFVKPRMVVTELNENGELLWQKEIYDIQEVEPSKILTCVDGSFAICGKAFDRVNTITYSFLLKIDSKGKLLWNRTFGRMPYLTTLDIANTPDGGIILVGAGFNSSKGGMVFKLNSQGDIQWGKNYSAILAPSNSWGICKIRNTYDGGYFITGHAPRHHIKLDSTGNVQWAFNIVGKTNVIYDWRQTLDSGFFFVYSQLRSVHDFNITLIRVNKNGDTLWTKAYHSFDSSSINIGHIAELGDGGFVICGAARSEISTNSNAYLLKVDSNGKIIWSQFYGPDDKTYTTISDVIKHQDGSFLLCGEYREFNPGPIISSNYLIKTDSTGFAGCQKVKGNFYQYPANLSLTTRAINHVNYSFDSTLVFSTDSVSIQKDVFLCENRNDIGITNFSELHAPQLSPNPTNRFFKVNINNDQPFGITIYNIHGRIMFEKHQLNDTHIDVGSFPAGIYIVVLEIDRKRFSSKLIKN